MIALLTIIIGCGIYAYYINNIGKILQMINKKQQTYKDYYTYMNSYMRKKNFSLNLKVKVNNYLQYICNQEQSWVDEEARKIIHKLPDNL